MRRIEEDTWITQKAAEEGRAAAASLSHAYFLPSLLMPVLVGCLVSVALGVYGGVHKGNSIVIDRRRP